MPRRPRTTPRKKPRQERSVATVDAILDATARVLCTTGYDRASTNRIALAAGVSVGSLYQYFPSKEALVAALAARHMATMTRARAVQARRGRGRRPCPWRCGRSSWRCSRRTPSTPGCTRSSSRRCPASAGSRTSEAWRERWRPSSRPCSKPDGRSSAGRNVETMALLLVTVVEAATHAAVLAELEPARSRAVADELTDLVLRYLVA